MNGIRDEHGRPPQQRFEDGTRRERLHERANRRRQIRNGKDDRLPILALHRQFPAFLLEPGNGAHAFRAADPILYHQFRQGLVAPETKLQNIADVLGSDGAALRVIHGIPSR